MASPERRRPPKFLLRARVRACAQVEAVEGQTAEAHAAARAEAAVAREAARARLEAALAAAEAAERARAAEARTVRALIADGREEWEKRLGPEAARRLGNPDPAAAATAGGPGGLSPLELAELSVPVDLDAAGGGGAADAFLGPRATVYKGLALALFQGLERAAQANDKYREVVRLEKRVTDHAKQAQ